MRSGSLFQRPTWAPLTAAPGGSASHGAWLTPAGLAGVDHSGKVGAGGEFHKQVTQWMTPRASMASNGSDSASQKRLQEGSGLGLKDQAKQWRPTPTAALMNDGEDPSSWQARADRLKAKGINGNGAGMPLTVAAAAWPTPMAADARGSAGTRKHELPNIVAAWPTPASRDYRTPNLLSYDERCGEGKGKGKGEQLANFVVHQFSPQGPAAPTGRTFSPQPLGSLPPSPSKESTTPPKPSRLLSLRLNPYFVEWLMGWPMGWTSPIVRVASSAQETASWHCALAAHLSSLLSAPGCSTEAAP